MRPAPSLPRRAPAPTATPDPGTPRRLIADWVRPFADHLLRRELPGVEAPARAEVVGFVGRRVTELPSPLLAGVAVLAAAFRLLLLLPGGRFVIDLVSDHPLPGVGEYPRLIRSLVLAHVFETWPSRRADGSLPA